MTPVQPHRRPHLMLYGLALSALLLSTGCGKEIGDDCSSNAECGVGRVCDLDSEDGYCTVTPCTPGSCPEEAVCVEFENLETYCMRGCGSDDDCRGGYSCFDEDDTPVPYCRQNP